MADKNSQDSTMKEIGVEAGKTLGDSVSAALDALENEIDAVALSGNTDDGKINTSNESAEDAKASEKPTDEIAELRGIVETQNETIERLIGTMGKMVRQYGADYNDGIASNTKAFPSEDKTPLLADIELGK